MKKSLLLPLVFSLCACSNGITEVLIDSLSPSNETSVILANNDVYEFVSNYSYGSSRDYLGKGDIFAPKACHLSWSAVKNAERYEIRMSLNSDLANYENYLSTKNEIDVEDLFVDSSYYWQVFAFKGDEQIGKSEIAHFRTAKTPRTIYLEGVSNTRDIGGYVTESGKKIKQGMVYRGARLDLITENGMEKAQNVYKIKTDLDLRRNEEVKSFFSPLGGDTQLIHVPSPWWLGENGIDQSMYWSSICQDFEVFTNPDNYPILFHCSIGQDRTGTLAFLLGALLGMSEKDLSIDYELSSFSSVVWDAASPIYVDDKLKYQYGPLHDYINKEKWGDTLSERAEFFLKMIGMEQEELDSIKQIMLCDN